MGIPSFAKYLKGKAYASAGLLLNRHGPWADLVVFHARSRLTPSLLNSRYILYTPLDEKSRIKLPIIRVMPNTPALVLAGMAGMSANRHASNDDIKIVRFHS
jgi:hypothetical protein